MEAAEVNRQDLLDLSEILDSGNLSHLYPITPKRP
jgi:hypothetical protein